MNRSQIIEKSAKNHIPGVFQEYLMDKAPDSLSILSLFAMATDFGAEFTTINSYFFEQGSSFSRFQRKKPYA